jgi:hypothetical protein
VAGLLKEAGADIVSGPLSEAIFRAPLDKAPRLIRYLGIIHYNNAKKIVNMLLTTHADAEIISGCLKIVKDPGMLDIIRRYAGHDRWFVRAQVASALGRLGTEEDLERLCLLLADSHWWVRYRAARALANLPFITMDDLRGLSIEHFDRYSRDVLKQVIAEKEVL